MCEARCEGAARSTCAPLPTLSLEVNLAKITKNVKIMPKT
jgi:hypothetical protein